MHQFSEDLCWAESQADAPYWWPLYKDAFPSLVHMERVKKDGWAQRGGIDRLLVLESGKTLHVEEKARRKYYPDVALEHWSNYERQIPGWIEKDLATDYFCYVWVPKAQGVLFPFHTLRKAWLTNRESWMKQAEYRQNGFYIAKSPNPGYTTYSTCVPLPIISAAVKDAMKVSWSSMPDPAPPVNAPDPVRAAVEVFQGRLFVTADCPQRAPISGHRQRAGPI